jgi:sterol desaturase/sphingolipid hydroxylase (fatty acid hydroxylase superfamily)
VRLAIVLTMLAAIFTVLERRWPSVPGQRWWRTTRPGDLAYWFILPAATTVALQLTVVVAVFVVARLIGAPHDRVQFDAWIAARRAVVAHQPRALQMLEMLLLADLLGYWAHRLMHRGRLWRFHAIHHATRALDWVSAARLHPVNEIVTRVIQMVPLFYIGFRSELLTGLTPVLIVYAIFLHANLSWTFGPLRWVIASPAFHRWHHTSEREGLDRNFAAMFPVWDLVFGTFRMPRDRCPMQFGLLDEDVPDSWLAQMAYPFRRRRVVQKMPDPELPAPAPPA